VKKRGAIRAFDGGTRRFKDKATRATRNTKPRAISKGKPLCFGVPRKSGRRSVLSRPLLADFGEFEKLEADHKLILTLSSSLLNFVKQGKEELFRKRVKTYVTTVLEHNQQEEILVFPYWKSVSNDTAKSALEHAKRIIQAFGVDEYLEFTGMSKQFFDSL